MKLGAKEENSRVSAIFQAIGAFSLGSALTFGGEIVAPFYFELERERAHRDHLMQNIVVEFVECETRS